MKKKYINPNITLVNVKTQLPIAGSEIPMGDPGSANSAESRMFGGFDDDDDEDF